MGIIFLFLFCLFHLFFSQLFVRPPQTAISFSFAFLFLGDGVDLLLIFLIILTATNTEKSEYGSAGIKFSAGIFIALIFTIGAVVALKVLEKKLPATDEGGETVTYVCGKCGKKAKAKDKFCNACGGEIEKKVVVKEEYACEKCGKRASAKEKFCSACGGEIKVKEKPPVAEPTEAEASAETEASATEA